MVSDLDAKNNVIRRSWCNDKNRPVEINLPDLSKIAEDFSLLYLSIVKNLERILVQIIREDFNPLSAMHKCSRQQTLAIFSFQKR